MSATLDDKQITVTLGDGGSMEMQRRLRVRQQASASGGGSGRSLKRWLLSRSAAERRQRKTYTSRSRALRHGGLAALTNCTMAQTTMRWRQL